MAEHALLIPDIIERILSPLDSLSVIRLASLTKSSREVVRDRRTWLGISRTRDYRCMPEYFSSMPTAHLWLVSFNCGHLSDCASGPLSYNAARLAPNADPAEQVLELEYLLEKVQNGCTAYTGPICFIIDANRHLMSGAIQVQAQYLRVLDGLLSKLCIPVDEIVFDIVMPHLWQYLNNLEIFDREPGALLNLANRLLKKYWIVRRYGRELLDNHVVDLYLQHLKQKSTDNSVGVRYKEILAKIFAYADESTVDRLLPQLHDFITMLGNDITRSTLDTLTDSPNEQVWKALSLVPEIDYRMLMSKLVQMAPTNPRQFWRIVQLDRLAQLLPKILRRLSQSKGLSILCEVLTWGFANCAGWLQISCIQKLIDKNIVTQIVSRAYLDRTANTAVYTIAAGACASQEATLAKFGILKPIVAKTKDSDRVEANIARDHIKKLVERRKYAPFIVEYLQNKEIKL